MEPTSSRAGAAKPGPIKVNRKAKFHLLHGDDESALDRQRAAIVAAHLETPEEREENYRDIAPPGTQGNLMRVLGDVLSELSTVSFLPKSPRVVALSGVTDFFEAKGKGKKAAAARKKPAEGKLTASEHLAAFITRELPALPAVLIVIAVEDYEKWRKVNPANPVVALAQKQGTLMQFREQGVQFLFFDALFARRTAEALALWRDWLEQNGGSPKPYAQLAAQLRLLIQAKTASSPQLKSRGITPQRLAKELLPLEADRNVFLIRPDFRREKLIRFAANFTFNELLAAYEKLEQLQKFSIPLLSDPFVPDRRLLSELWILEFAGGRGAGD